MLDRLSQGNVRQILSFIDNSHSFPENINERCRTLNTLRQVNKQLEKVLRTYPCYSYCHLDRVPSEKRHLCRAMVIDGPTSIPEHIERAEVRRVTDLESLPWNHHRLKRLVLHQVSLGDLDVPLPPYITHVEAHLRVMNDLIMLPSRLQYLCLSQSADARTGIRNDINIQACTLPRNLRILELRDCFCVRSLPEHILHLRVVRCRMEIYVFPPRLISCQLSDVTVTRLPKMSQSVRHVSLSNVDLMVVRLPQNLRTLEVSTSSDLPPVTWFPPSLRGIALKTHLPESLEERERHSSSSPEDNKRRCKRLNKQCPNLLRCELDCV
ncbi:MAG: hypothetical protein KVP17_003003 [Porospora cf. gigantea B]|uniref:uncharacterized protein n=1 Tax=Porospora cf. gigantea B TaxID=2853592 RepID=UPI003571B338|nr:MAG: hypothetical protein KVP17_003003 [Porospora cf. gigantea B]